MQRQPGRALAQEEACQGPQWPQPGTVQRQPQPPPPPAFRPGEQPSSGTHTRQEEEETPQQETLCGKLKKILFSLTVPITCNRLYLVTVAE